MKNPFYNAKEKRLRSGLRIIIQSGVFLFGTILAGVVLAFVMVAILAAQGKLNSDLLQDPGSLNAVIMNTSGSLFVLFSQVVSLILIILTMFLAARFLDRRKFIDFGFHFSKRWFWDLGFGLFLGALLMALIFLVEYAFGWVEITGYVTTLSVKTPASTIILYSLVGYICVGIYEEMLFRGYIFRNLAEGLNFKTLGTRGGLWLAYLISSSIFGIAHLLNPNASLISTVNIILAGLFLGLGFVLTGELAIPIGLHITWNFFQGNVFGFPVSGTGSGATVIQINQLGSDWITGGVFGPEAGLIGIIAILIGSLLTILYVKQTRGDLNIQYRLADYKSTINNNEGTEKSFEEKQVLASE
ncbi:MAG: CPBP family intramembrane metalloprotease domain-containing protein [Anaerolineaceae bacterium]|nr:CPBP family intramembrane metalloprotease domain-containing protein [Anaerolineaceae bacterium]